MQNRLYDFILTARQWPEHHKKIFAAVTSGTITLIITAGWATILPGQFNGLSSAGPISNQAAAVNLSIVATTTDTQGANTTQSLQDTLNQGSQIFNSVKNSFVSFFIKATSSPSHAATGVAPTITITNPTQQQINQNSNPYTNLKYYVSNGVLITSPSSGSENSAISVNR